MMHLRASGPRILILGMSHVRALRSALTAEDEALVEVINLRLASDVFDSKTQKLSLGARNWSDFDVVCLSMGGNLHNVFSLMEGREPFALGDAQLGRVPTQDMTRHFVPRDMLTAEFARRLKPMLQQERVAHEHFPRARFIHLCPPPPVRALRPSAASTTTLAAEVLLRFQMVFEAAPSSDLRRRIFDVQREIYAANASALGAVFLEPPAEAITPDGLLDDRYWDDDPTHGNAAYGRLVLRRVLELAAEVPA